MSEFIGILTLNTNVAEGCQLEDLLIPGHDVSGEENYAVSGSITVSANVTVKGGARLILNAGKKILFNPGFRVQAGGRLNARVGPSP